MMNSEKVYIEGYVVGFMVDSTGTREKRIQVSSGEIVSIDESFIHKSITPEKVKIPRMVADWIKFAKFEDYHLLGAMDAIATSGRKNLYEWFREDDNMDLFARAWLDGYEVEKEKRYIITLKSSKQKLYYHTEHEDYIFSSYDGVFYSEYHTKTDLEENGMSWVFDCPGIKIEEVDE
ncbi:DUF1642 domain-containing protein [Streptococcus sp. Marseille-P7375]|uniref:DUF1642 domain-containing protein n=1 Tax=Streptococcus sp. Marseille-P7375 TaxID=2487318 RepID=UPI0021CCE724|nr:DUF1642 domain-containing protein [Streptococcus sp. Marseille-P7375]